MKVLTIVGARPQFIKAAMISRELAEHGEVEEILVHTGQHFDRNMSELFFEELDIPEPKVNLGISGGTHAQMTARMMIALEDAMTGEKPDVVLLYGDTNSTLAGALAAAKLDIPICHAEAGARTRFKSNPEEVNRICTDHLASANCAPTPSCFGNLVEEGLGAVSAFTGDLMYDAFAFYSERAKALPPTFRKLDGSTLDLTEPYVYLTCHRQENATESKLTEMLSAIKHLGIAVVYPVHPRVRSLVKGLASDGAVSNLHLVEPVGYLESVRLINGAQLVITDSGGLQREAFFAQKKCVTLLPFPSAEELLVGHRNTLMLEFTEDSLMEAISVPQSIDDSFRPFGDGRAAVSIVENLIRIVKGGAVA